MIYGDSSAIRRWVHDERFEFQWNWRQVAIHVLAKTDPDAAAYRLSELLRRQPRFHVANEACDLLVERRRYECAPILLRYALASSANEFQSEWTEKLVQMRIPQAAQLIFSDTIKLARLRNRPDLVDLLTRRTEWDWVDGDGDHIIVAGEQRNELKRLLQHDAGENLFDWIVLYTDTIDSVDTPLTNEQHIEAQRTSPCFGTYLRGLGLWRRIEHNRRRQYALDRLHAVSPEDAAQVEVLNNDVLRHRAPELFDEKSRLARALLGFDRYFEEARWKVDVPSPKWDAVTIDELEQEMAQYLRNAIAAAREELGDRFSDADTVDDGE